MGGHHGEVSVPLRDLGTMLDRFVWDLDQARLDGMVLEDALTLDDVPGGARRFGIGAVAPV